MDSAFAYIGSLSSVVYHCLQQRNCFHANIALESYFAVFIVAFIITLDEDWFIKMLFSQANGTVQSSCEKASLKGVQDKPI